MEPQSPLQNEAEYQSTHESLTRTTTAPITEPTPTINPTPAPQHKHSIMEMVRFIILSLGLVLIIRVFIAQPFIVNGSSMDPTFVHNQYLIVYELGYYFNEPERGDVVVFKFPGDESKHFIKRVIGVPGDTVTVKNGQVSVSNDENPDGIILEEPYIDTDTPGDNELTLGQDEFYVMGDNRLNSSDSRFWGAVDKKNILGKALIRLFPLDTIETLPGQYDHDF